MADPSAQAEASIWQSLRPLGGLIGFFLALIVVIAMPQYSAADSAQAAAPGITDTEFASPLTGDITIAVAANFLNPARQFAAAYEKASGQRVTVVFGSTGKLYAQIRQGAPFDVFLAADTERPQRLIDANYALSASKFVYATGRLALWQPAATVVDAQSVWRFPVPFIALANPALAPYGRAAINALAVLADGRTSVPQTVLADSVSGAFSMVASGNAQAGLVALSHLMAANIDPSEYWLVPTDLYKPIAQMAVLLKQAEHNATAQGFMAFLSSASVQAQLPALGYAAAQSHE